MTTLTLGTNLHGAESRLTFTKEISVFNAQPCWRVISVCLNNNTYKKYKKAKYITLLSQKRGEERLKVKLF